MPVNKNKPRTPTKVDENSTQYLRSVINAQASQINDLTERIDHLEKTVNNLNKNMEIMENDLAALENIKLIYKKISEKSVILESKLIECDAAIKISSHVNDILSTKIDDINQYTRRECLIFNGISCTENEKEDDVKARINQVLEQSNVPPFIIHDIDRAHRIGAYDKVKNCQPVIVKFK